MRQGMARHFSRTSILGIPFVHLNLALHWHCHFIQKFETQPNIEFTDLNPGYAIFHGRMMSSICKPGKVGKQVSP
jgi:hypothetical protein